MTALAAAGTGDLIVLGSGFYSRASFRQEAARQKNPQVLPPHAPDSLSRGRAFGWAPWGLATEDTQLSPASLPGCDGFQPLGFPLEPEHHQMFSGLPLHF